VSDSCLGQLAFVLFVVTVPVRTRGSFATRTMYVPAALAGNPLPLSDETIVEGVH